MSMEIHESDIKASGQSALWYAWGQIDRRPTIEDTAEDSAYAKLGFTTDHGFEFSRLYQEAARNYRSGKKSSMPSVMSAWQEFVRAKQERGITAELTVDDLDYLVRMERELAAEREAAGK